MKQAHIFVSGKVQGVWYRQFVKDNSKKLGLVGWVRNLDDNRVEAIFQGRIQDIEQMIQLCRKGSPFASVENIEVEWEDAVEMFEDFQIK